MLIQKSLFQIGLVAKQSSIPIKTIRYYEEFGLLKASGRTEGGYRLFDSDVFSRLNFIKRAQKLGLSLSEIKEFLDVYDQGNLPCNQVKEKLSKKIAEIEQQIEQLQILKRELKELLSGEKINTQNLPATICPIIEQN
ncbi:heavy metal-responsive transcriptional regulator [Aphanothece hegewaldii CCALA 016]|uniref:Heavy metal-responsive transcriptional regulator n=1 Tax=Aphanothece hegewaldii CCALA 016 TaxID=2107694 RepID=A0A2T1M3Z9_9CHRO|nr:heavy metal-responsive transcriptional regulator [Aphanothece hegewaldii]PSF39571.1 heavy metal-responsive transcriptional regulator [Aphanothece hegewaldii CCALA 016]